MSKLSIVELLQRVGDDKVFVQNLTENMTGARKKKNGDVAVTFVTGDQYFGINERAFGEPVPYVGLVVWLPREDVERVKAERATALATEKEADRG